MSCGQTILYWLLDGLDDLPPCCVITSAAYHGYTTVLMPFVETIHNGLNNTKQCTSMDPKIL